MAGSMLFPGLVFAQSPDKISYQAVIRDAEGNLVTGRQIGLQIRILQGSATGTAVYTEILTPSTNANGLVSLDIGGQAGFEEIDWSAGPFFIETGTDPSGGTDYTITGTSQLLSVPYALHARTAETISGTVVEEDPVFSVSPAAGIAGTDIDNWNEAHNWGDHLAAEYLTEEVDPVFAASAASNISQVDIESWDAKSEFDGEFSSLTGIPNSVIMPAGVINIFAGITAPEGYLICDGREVSRTEYADLFVVIGTTYGEGDGSTTFNLPDLQSRIPVGISAEPEFDELGKTGGAKNHVLTVNEMPAHSHTGFTGAAGAHNHGGRTYLAGQHRHSGTTYGSGGSGSKLTYDGLGAANRVAYHMGSHTHDFVTNTVGDHEHGIPFDGNHNHSISIQNSGGGNPHNNLQPYIVLNFIIKY